jgi:hypothetical protein
MKAKLVIILSILSASGGSIFARGENVTAAGSKVNCVVLVIGLCRVHRADEREDIPIGDIEGCGVRVLRTKEQSGRNEGTRYYAPFHSGVYSARVITNPPKSDK